MSKKYFQIRKYIVVYLCWAYIMIVLFTAGNLANRVAREAIDVGGDPLRLATQGWGSRDDLHDVGKYFILLYSNNDHLNTGLVEFLNGVYI